MSAALAAVAAALMMEPVAALTHRAVMHRPVGWRWHRSHHRPRHRGFEANDLFPAVFAAVTIGVMAAGGTQVRAAGAGIAAYGLAYALVHDVCVHGRLTGGRPLLPGRWLRWVATAHAVHHRTGRAPYGFLAPIVPRSERAATATLRRVDTRARTVKTS
jgi:beta-carotene 3-hydroxylase